MSPTRRAQFSSSSRALPQSTPFQVIYQQTFTCTGRQIIGGQEVICSGVHGEINFSEGLAHSCNIVFGSIAEQLGAKTLERYARRLGLGESFDCAGYHTKAGCC